MDGVIFTVGDTGLLDIAVQCEILRRDSVLVTAENIYTYFLVFFSNDSKFLS
jgi:hypothetical protein